MVGMNVVLSAINIWFIVKLLRERHDEAAFEVLEVRPDDAYLRHVLRVHGADIADVPAGLRRSDPAAHPDDAPSWSRRATRPSASCCIEPDGDTARRAASTTSRARYRDFSPGEFVWRRSGLLREPRLPPGRHVAPDGRARTTTDSASAATATPTCWSCERANQPSLEHGQDRRVVVGPGDHLAARGHASPLRDANCARVSSDGVRITHRLSNAPSPVPPRPTAPDQPSSAGRARQHRLQVEDAVAHVDGEDPVRRSGARRTCASPPR